MAAYRFWRIFCRSNAYGSHTALAEVAMAAASGGANLIGPGTALASSSYNASSSPAMAVDGDPATFWNSNTGLPDWWGYDFTTTVSVIEVKVTARNDGYANQGPSAWDLQSSDDGTSWGTEHSFTSAPWTPGSQQTFSYTPLTPIGTGQVGGALAAVAGTHAAPSALAASAAAAAAGYNLSPSVLAAAGGAAVMGFHAASKAGTGGVWAAVMVRQPQAAPPLQPVLAPPQILIMA